MSSIAAGLALAGVALAWAVAPLLALPPPSGPHGVGTTTLAVSADRPARTVAVRLWYPAVAADGTPRWPTLDWLRGRIAVAGAEPAAGRFPVVLAIPGWNNRPEDTTALAQELASHGFVVAGVGYPVGDGVPEASRPMDFSSDAAFAATLALADRRVRLQAADASRVLDALAARDARDPDGRLTGRLDTGHAGIFGFSFGGAVAAQTAWQDRRFQAVMNLDGWLFGEAATQPFHRPFLDINDGTPLPGADDLNAADAERRNTARLTLEDARHRDALLEACGGYQVTIAGSHHQQFTDAGLLDPVDRLRAGNGIDSRRVAVIVQAYALAFFGNTLDRRPAPLLAEPQANRFREAALRLFAPRTPE